MCEIWDLGIVKYREAWELQRRLHRQRVEGRIPDLLLLLEHPPTITIGRSGSLDNVLISGKLMVQAGLSLFFVDRGGDVTYHGLGQLVGYPIFNLREHGGDLHLYVRNLEEVIIRTLRDFSIEADSDESHPGVWVKGEEIGAIGLSVKKWVSMHGFALNVNTDLDHFAFINPCGFSDKRATSISKVIGRKISTAEVSDSLKSHFSDIFGFSTGIWPGVSLSGRMKLPVLWRAASREGSFVHSVPPVVGLIDLTSRARSGHTDREGGFK